MENSNQNPLDLESLSPKEREDRIETLEIERLSLTKKIEALMTEYIRVSGRRNLKRKEKVGRAPNDYEKGRKG